MSGGTGAGCLAVAFAFMAGVLVSRVAHVLGETIDRAQRAQREAERARAELAETMSREVSHRVKNNLAMAAGLLQIRMEAESDPHAAEVLRETVLQLYAFADIHDQMGRAVDGDVDLLETLRRMVRWVQQVFPEEYVEVSVEGDAVDCPAKEATTISVIANELITNAIKHGGPEAEGRRRVEARLVREGGGVSLLVWNSGNPVPPGFRPGEREGVGLELVRSLVVDQLGGAFRLEPRGGGTLARVELGEGCLGGRR